MIEKTMVRQNMMDDKNYRAYCMQCQSMPRVDKNFKCPVCGKVSSFDEDFWKRYIKKYPKEQVKP